MQSGCPAGWGGPVHSGKGLQAETAFLAAAAMSLGRVRHRSSRWGVMGMGTKGAPIRTIGPFRSERASSAMVAESFAPKPHCLTA